MRKTVLASALALLSFALHAADSVQHLPPIEVSAPAPDSLDANRVSATSVRELLGDAPAMSFKSAGGVSALPVLRGLADDRIRIRVDGMDVSSACGNHMNPPLSYVDPQQVGRVDVLPGVTPVSEGGDSIAGSIAVRSPDPVFAKAGAGMHRSGSLSLAARSVDDSYVGALGAALANEDFSFGYNASWRAGDSYEDGNGNKVLDTLYKARNQSATLAAQGGGQRVVLRVGEQTIPYQGFPNQYMDMVRNQSLFANLNYVGEFAWGRLDARLYWQDTEHEMGFFTSEKTGTMPMNTRGRDLGYAIKAEIPISAAHLLRVGQEYHRQRLDDWWPPVPGSMMMEPDAFVNINNGKRDRYAIYGEAESRWGAQWSTRIGAREEFVRMDTGTVQPYSNMPGMMNPDPAYAAAFNSRDRARSDNNLDFSLLARFEPDAASSYEFGLARKLRSPNLYERYTWGRSIMDMTMIGWFGDGNGYVGDPDLKPEKAWTLSAAATWRDAAGTRWELRMSPHLSWIRDFIDVDVIDKRFMPYMLMGDTRALLRFANHDARLWGVDLAGKLTLWDDARFGRGQLRGTLAYTRGQRTDGGDLYHVMPLNATLGLEHAIRNWTALAEVQIVDNKSRVDDRRIEDRTAGYALVNLRAGYQVNDILRLSAGVTNLFNRQYQLPLGGAYLAGYKAASGGQLVSLPGQGRSFDLGVSVKF
jgi:iron complex outermembrane receptor protein